MNETNDGDEKKTTAVCLVCHTKIHSVKYDGKRFVSANVVFSLPILNFLLQYLVLFVIKYIGCISQKFIFSVPQLVRRYFMSTGDLV